MESNDLITVEEAARRLSVGRTKMYELVQAGEIQSVKIGRAVRVIEQSLLDFVDRLSRASTHEDTDENGDPRYVGRP